MNPKPILLRKNRPNLKKIVRRAQQTKPVSEMETTHLLINSRSRGFELSPKIRKQLDHFFGVKNEAIRQFGSACFAPTLSNVRWAKKTYLHSDGHYRSFYEIDDLPF